MFETVYGEWDSRASRTYVFWDVFIEEKLSMGYGKMAGWKSKEEVVCKSNFSWSFFTVHIFLFSVILWNHALQFFYCLAGKLTDHEGLQKTFGNSKEFTRTAVKILSGLSGNLVNSTTRITIKYQQLWYLYLI